MASFYITLGERIILYFYGNERKNKSFIEKWKIIFIKPSHCPNCKKVLNPIELIPFFGYFFLGGKCKNCNTKLGIIYPITELFFPLLFAFAFIFTKNFSFSLIFIIFIGHVFVSMITDLNKYILDFENLFFILIFGSLSNYLLTDKFFELDSIFVFIAFLLFYGIIYLIKPDFMGLGDVIFAPVFSFIIGHPWWIFFLNTSYTLALLGTYVFRDREKKFLKQKIPMGFYFGLSLIFSMMVKILPNNFFGDLDLFGF
ncbi:MAG: prepilin peptidase [Leptospiraceae bacterium]|nr:prepilin peptidase [Leptospiraceae bacterium]